MRDIWQLNNRMVPRRYVRTEAEITQEYLTRAEVMVETVAMLREKSGAGVLHDLHDAYPEDRSS